MRLEPPVQLLVRNGTNQAVDLRDVVLVRLHDIPGIRSAQTIFVLDEAQVSRVAPALLGP